MINGTSQTGDMFKAQSGVNSSQGGALSKMRAGKKSGAAKALTSQRAKKAAAPQPDSFRRSAELKQAGGGAQGNPLGALLQGMQNAFRQ